jgi:hypothetical protein
VLKSTWRNLFDYNELETFLDTVNKETKEHIQSGCWRWIGSLTKWGYGYYYENSRKIYAHRAAALTHRCQNIVGKHVHHRCGNKWCVNPFHLKILTEDQHIWQHCRGRRDMGTCVVARAKYENGQMLMRGLNAAEERELNSC